MSAILEAAKVHFRDRMANIQSLVVPEWDNTKIFFRPSMNFKDQGIVLKLHGDGLPAEAIIMTLILKSMNEDGSKMFTKSNKTEMLLNIDPEIVSRIVTEMSDDEPTVEDATKN